MKKIAILSSLAFITGCSSVQVKEYQNEKPILKLENYLNGQLDAHGIFKTEQEKVVKRFYVAIKADWKNDTGTINEDFTYSDGSKSNRVWTIKKLNDDKYTGTAADVIGVAQGEVAGNALQWKYTLELPVDDKTYHVQFDDWMYLMDDKVMINKSKMTKFGIYLGEVTLTFIKK